MIYADSSDQDCISGSVRLVNGLIIGSTQQGIVELCFNGVWSRLCNEGWDYRDAIVTCNQLGLPSYGNVNILLILMSTILIIIIIIGAVTLNNFALDSLVDVTIARTNVQCTGMESEILACPSSNDTKTCNHRKVAGVVCSQGMYTSRHA